MPLPRALARFNRVATNRVSRPLAAHLPWFAVIVHRGRASGTEYRTPVNAWRDDRSVVVALTYGPGTDWMKNLTAAGGGGVIIGWQRRSVGMPELMGKEGMSRMPAIVRPVLRILDVDEFAVLPLISPDRPT